MIGKIAFATSLFVLVTACETIEPSMLSVEDAAAIQAGQKAAIVSELIYGVTDCEQSKLVFQNIDTEKKVGVFSVARGSTSGQNGPGVVAVEPGRYKLQRVDCYKPGYYPRTLPALDSWFTDFEVEAGTLNYTGSLDADLVRVWKDYESNVASDALLAVFSLGLSLAIPSPEEVSRRFPTYRFTSREAQTRVFIDATMPEFGALIVLNQPLQILSERAMSIAFQSAYQRNEDGTAPTEEEISSRIGDALNKAFFHSIVLLHLEDPEKAKRAATSALGEEAAIEIIASLDKTLAEYEAGIETDRQGDTATESVTNEVAEST